MKKIFLTGFSFLAILLFSTQINAQELGIRAGANYADISDIEDGSKGIIGLQFGPVIEFGLSEKANLHIGALFAMKGAKDDDSDSKLNTNYIDIPLLFHFKFGGFYAELGPQFSLLLSADSDGEDVKELFKSSDLAAILGVGYDLGGIRLDLRYGLGLSNILDESFDELNNKNKVITLGATFMFGGSSDSSDE